MVIKNDACPDHLRWQLLQSAAADSESWSRCSAARHPEIGEQLLVKLAADEDDIVRCYVAENPTTPIELLLKLRSDPCEKVRGRVRNLPRREYDARLAEAKCTGTSMTRLLELAESGFIGIRLAAVGNASLPAGDRDRLTTLIFNDIDSAIGSGSKTRACQSSLSYDDIALLIRALGILGDPSNQAELRRASRSKDLLLRAAAIVAPDTPAAVLSQMLEDPSEEIRALAAMRAQL
jgi:hypothetical protein